MNGKAEGNKGSKAMDLRKEEQQKEKSHLSIIFTSASHLLGDSKTSNYLAKYAPELLEGPIDCIQVTLIKGSLCTFLRVAN